MKASFSRSLAMAVGVSLGAGVLASGYILNKFRGYEDSATRVMSGDQKSVLAGHLLEARIRGAEELAKTSVDSEEANEAFKTKVNSIIDETKALAGLAKELGEKAVEEAKRATAELSTDSSDQVEDLFVQYRNIKVNAFNLYRMAWANKWMNVAKSMGQVNNDLDNTPYHAATAAVSGVNAKINGLTTIIARSELPQASKLLLFGQLNVLKTQLGRYHDALARADKIRAKRTDALKRLNASLKKFNEAQGKGLMQFANEARAEVFKGIVAFLLFLLFAMGWYALATRRLHTHVTAIAAHISKQVSGWITAGGSISAQGFANPERPDAEFAETYQTLDQTMRRMNSLRKEDILVKRLLNVPFLLVNRGKQAIFWNSALSILGKVRALEETGPVAYATLLRLTDAQGKAVDPIDRAITDNKEVSQLALLRAGDDGVAAHVVCTPVVGPDHQCEYVMVHIRDLREENRRAEAELDRQLEHVRVAAQALARGQTPAAAPRGVRKAVSESVTELQKFALELQEKSTVMAGQADTMWERMAREGSLKKSVHDRMSGLRDEVSGVRSQLAELKNFADTVANRIGQFDVQAMTLHAEYAEIRKRGDTLLQDLKINADLITACLARIEEAAQMTGRVRANERTIHALLEKSALLTANNSIIGSKWGSKPGTAKRELTPDDVVAITENITQVMSQFERSYRFIEQSVDDVERGLGDLTEKLRANLSACVKLTEDDQDMMSAVYGSGRMILESTKDVSDLTKQLSVLKAGAARVSTQLQGVETKLSRLVQIGEASMLLQSQLELGFKGMCAVQSSNASRNATRRSSS